MNYRDAENQLKRFALLLRNAAPDQWEQFLKAFEAYDWTITVAVTRADPASILNAQGAAQQTQTLLKLFVECATQPGPQPPSAQQE